MKKLTTYDPSKKKQVLCGKVVGDTLFRDVKSNHFMWKYDGYGIQEIVFQRLKKAGIKKIILKETDTDKRHEADITTWDKLGVVADEKHGVQRFLKVDHMNKHKLKQPDIKKEKKRTEQRRMF